MTTNVKAVEKKTQQFRNADPELWRRAKAAAAVEGKTMTVWLETIVREHLDGKKS